MENGNTKTTTARIRNNSNDLKRDLFRNHLSADSSCPCRSDNDDASHYFFFFFFCECENFNNFRILMFHRLRPLHPLSLNIILYGKPSLSYVEIFLRFQTVRHYIKNSGRFNESSTIFYIMLHFCCTVADG